jgi:hypothetical protein
MGDAAAAKDFKSQVLWRDMESRSLSQAADALGKLADSLGVPVEMLWEKIPGWTQNDTTRAREIIEKGGGLEEAIASLIASTAPPPQGE